MTSLQYLGHAGFALRGRTWLMMDPWLSQGGAFLRSWFQSPSNGHLRNAAKSLTPDDTLYISHHHQDHFDRDTLAGVDKHVCLVIPRFKRRGFRNEIDALGFRKVIELDFGESITRGGFKITLFTDDQYTNEDSGILVECEGGERVLNMNDCRAYDRLEADHIRDIDVFAMQFSGATYYPSCFMYSQEDRDKLSAEKNRRKFTTVAGVIGRINPKAYIPSAGPAQFVDKTLEQFNHGNPSPFPSCEQFIAGCPVQGIRDKFVIMQPGDLIPNMRWPHIACSTKSLAPSQPQHACEYGRDGDAFDLFTEEWTRKAARAPRVTTSGPLVLTLEYEATSRSLIVDFATGIVTESDELPDERYQYTFDNRVMVEFFETGELWENLTLSLRMKVYRNPDKFDGFISDMVRLEASDIENYPVENASERITRAVGVNEYELDRYCPHNKGDMLNAKIESNEIVCPRHGWRFDLDNGGKCNTADCSINSKRISKA